MAAQQNVLFGETQIGKHRLCVFSEHAGHVFAKLVTVYSDLQRSAGFEADSPGLQTVVCCVALLFAWRATHWHFHDDLLLLADNISSEPKMSSSLRENNLKMAELSVLRCGSDSVDGPIPPMVAIEV